MSLELHDEIKRVSHAIITEYVRAYPSMPHTKVLLNFVDKLEATALKLLKGPPEGQAPLPGPHPDPEPPQTSGLMFPYSG